MRRSNQKLEVRLPPVERRELEALCRKGITSAARVRHARVLLLSDENHPDGQRPDVYIARAVGLSERSVVRIRQAYVREGRETAVERKRRAEPPTPPKLDGRAEAHLVRLCCSTPPSGRRRWTLQLLADELCRLQVVASICPETVRKSLKKIASSRGGRNGSASRTGTGRGSSRRWKTSSMSTAPRTMPSTR